MQQRRGKTQQQAGQIAVLHLACGLFQRNPFPPALAPFREIPAQVAQRITNTADEDLDALFGAAKPA